MPLDNCFSPPPGPGETGSRTCENYAEIRARQIAHWDNYIKIRSYCPWKTIILDRDPTVNDDYSSGFRTGQFWLNTVANTTWVCELAYPNGAAIWNSVGGTSSAVWIQETLSIPATTALVVSTVPLADFTHMKYIITTWNVDQTKAKSLEMGIINNAGTLSDNVFNRLNTGLDITVSPAINGLNMELTISNNESFTIETDLIRAKLG